MMNGTRLSATARPLPAPDEHAPLSVINTTGSGIRTVVTCSCGWKPAKGPDRGSTMNNGHMAHRRSKGLPRADYAGTVFGEGPWAGWTWNEWYAQHGGQGLDPYTGQPR